MEQLSSPKFTKNSKFRVSEIVKNDILGPFYLIHQNLISREIGLAVKLSQKSQALTSHFESFWSIVHNVKAVANKTQFFQKKTVYI